MSLARGNNYATAGYQGMGAERFQLDRSVFILDATAGQGYDAYDGSLYPDVVQPRHRTHRTVSAKWFARVFAAMLTLALLLMAVYSFRLRALDYEVSVLESQLAEINRVNAELDEKILEARDLSRISYAAVQTLKMVPVEDEPVYYIVAPDTRPYGNRGGTGNDHPE